MSILSRRKMLLGSVSVLAIFGAVLYARSGSGTTTLQFFDNKEKPTISFVQVRKTLDPYVDALIERSEKDFGEPGRLVGDLQNPVQLVRGAALFRAAKQVDGLKHLMQRNAAVLENGPDLDRELLAALALIALPHP
jgi:hypothetical protein